MDILNEFNTLPKPPVTYGERKYWDVAKRLADALLTEKDKNAQLEMKLQHKAIHEGNHPSNCNCYFCNALV